MTQPFPGLIPEACFFPSHLPLGTDGYPIVSNGKGGKSRGHQLTYRLFCGPIPKATMVLHSCGFAQCINPHHLYLGDAAQNAKDRARHGTTATGRRLPQTRLTPCEVLEIRGSKKRVTDLAAEFKTSKGNISSIRSMRSRSDVLHGDEKDEG